MRALLITGSNEDPRDNDDWETSVVIAEGSNASLDELIRMCDEEHHTEGRAIWLYEGDSYEDFASGRELSNGAVVYDMLFHPWDTDNVTLIRCAEELDFHAFVEDWRSEMRDEIAMEAGMMGGCDAYNDAMGY